jgi:hypothetical protein
MTHVVKSIVSYTKNHFFSLNNCAPELLEESLKDLVQKMVMSGEIAKPQVNICMFFGAH